MFIFIQKYSSSEVSQQLFLPLVWSTKMCHLSLWPISTFHKKQLSTLTPMSHDRYFGPIQIMWHRGQSWKTLMTLLLCIIPMAKIVAGKPLELLYFCIKMNTALARGIWQIFYALATSLLMAIIIHDFSLTIPLTKENHFPSFFVEVIPVISSGRIMAPCIYHASLASFTRWCSRCNM